MGVNGPDANFLVPLLGGLFKPIQRLFFFRQLSPLSFLGNAFEPGWLDLV